MSGIPAKGDGGTRTLGRSIAAAWRHRFKPLWRELEVPAFIAIGVAAVVLGFVGYRAYMPQRPPLDVAFMVIQLFRLMFFQTGPFPWELEAARWLALLVVMYAAFRVVAAIFYEQLGLLALRTLARGHVVIAGPGPGVAALVKAFYDAGYVVAVAERNLGREAVQRYREAGAIAVNGDPAERAVLRKARVDRARYLVAVSADDGANAEVALRARELCGGRATPLLCYAQIGDPRFCNQLMARFGFGTMGSPACRVEFVNASELAARALLGEHTPFAGDDGHIVTVGMTDIGESFLFLAAARWLSTHATAGRRLAITMLDGDASAKKGRLIRRYPVMATACDIAAIDGAPEGWFARGAPGNVYVFDESDAAALSTAIALLSVAGDRTVVACARRPSGLVDLAAGGRLNVFTAEDKVYRPDAVLGGVREVLAREVHARYVADQRQRGASPATNASTVPWEDLPGTMREANLANADDIVAKLAAAGCGIELLTDAAAAGFTFTPPEIERLAMMEHRRWSDERRAGGWTYAPGAKDVDRKLSPYLVPWDDLAEDVREYDRNVVRGIPRFLAGAGFQVRRMPPEGTPHAGAAATAAPVPGPAR